MATFATIELLSETHEILSERTEVVFRQREDGKREKVTRRIVTVRPFSCGPSLGQGQRIKERRERMKPFGSSIVGGKTTVGAEVFIEKPGCAPTRETQIQDMFGNKKKVLCCRFCKSTEHFSHSCPHKDDVPVAPVAPVAPATTAPIAGTGTGATATKSSYVPPHLRRRAEGSKEEDEPKTCLRVSNLSYETTEDDIRSLASRYGRVTRCHLVTHRDSGDSKGFAFVSFALHEDAVKAMTGLSHLPLHSMIIDTAWAENDRRSTSVAGPGADTNFRSGYGRQLPQTRS
jgi:translation initiation factor 3 subunit G